MNNTATVSMYIHTYIHIRGSSFTYVYIHICIHTYIHAILQCLILLKIHIYVMYTYIHTYIHIHVQTCGGAPKYGEPSATNGYDCQTPAAVQKSDAYDLVYSYAHNNAKFLDAFAQSFVRLTTVGYDYGDNNIVKFGKLTNLKC